MGGGGGWCCPEEVGREGDAVWVLVRRWGYELGDDELRGSARHRISSKSLLRGSELTVIAPANQEEQVSQRDAFDLYSEYSDAPND